MNQAALQLDFLIAPDTVLDALSRHIGADKGIHALELARQLAGANGGAAAERHLREVIVKLRMQGYHVCGLPTTGYHMAANVDELNRTCLWLHDRSMTGIVQVARMKNVSEPDLRGQLHLPT